MSFSVQPRRAEFVVPTNASVKDQYIIGEPTRGFLAGVCSGVSKCLVGHPFDTIKVRMQTVGFTRARFNGVIDCCRLTVTKEGPLALFKGILPPLLGWSAMDMVMVGTKVACDKALQRRFPDMSPVTSSFISGSVGGIARAFVACPIERVKAMMQVNYAKGRLGLFAACRRVVHEQGFVGFYQGLSASIVFGSMLGIHWSSFEMWKLVTEPMFSSNATCVFVSGGLGATTLWLAALPADTIKNRMLVYTAKPGMPKLSFLDCIYDIYHTRGGVRGFYAGFVPCMARSFPTNGTAFLVIDLALKHLP